MLGKEGKAGGEKNAHMTENRCESATCQRGEREETLLFGSASALNFIAPGWSAGLAAYAYGLGQKTLEIHSSFCRLYGKCEHWRGK